VEEGVELVHGINMNRADGKAAAIDPIREKARDIRLAQSGYLAGRFLNGSSALPPSLSPSPLPLQVFYLYSASRPSGALRVYVDLLIEPLGTEIPSFFEQGMRQVPNHKVPAPICARTKFCYFEHVPQQVQEGHRGLVENIGRPKRRS
jgi:hypothetical protein